MLIIHSKNHRLTIGPRVLVISGPISEDNKYGFRRHGGKMCFKFYWSFILVWKVQIRGLHRRVERKMSLPAFLCVLYIIKDAVITKLVCPYHTKNSLYDTLPPPTILIILLYFTYPVIQHIHSPSNSNPFKTTLPLVSKIWIFNRRMCSDFI